MLGVDIPAPSSIVIVIFASCLQQQVVLLLNGLLLEEGEQKAKGKPTRLVHLSKGNKWKVCSFTLEPNHQVSYKHHSRKPNLDPILSFQACGILRNMFSARRQAIQVGT